MYLFSRVSLFFKKCTIVGTLIPTMLFGLSPDLAQLWIKGNQEASKGRYSVAIQMLEGAAAAANYSGFERHLLAIDIAACLEKLEKYPEALDRYTHILESFSSKTGLNPTHIVALKGSIRCRLALGIDARTEVLKLKQWDPQAPVSYLLGSHWIIVPAISLMQNPDQIIISFLEDLFSMSSEKAKLLYKQATVTASGVSCFLIDKTFLSKLAELERAITLAELKLLLDQYSKDVPVNIPSADVSVSMKAKTLAYSASNCPVWIANWINFYTTRTFLYGNALDKGKELKGLHVQSSNAFFPELRARIIFEGGVFFESAGKNKDARACFTEASRSDQYGLTRTSAAGIFHTIRLAIQDKDLAFARKAGHRAGRLYLFVPKILPSYSENLILMGSDTKMLEHLHNSVFSEGQKLTAWTSPPKNLFLSISGMTVFWIGFEGDLMSSSKLKTPLTALKIYLGHGLFSTPPKGWLVSSILQKMEVDDI